MSTCKPDRLTRTLVFLVAAIFWTLPAIAQQGSHRSTRELKQDLRTTRQEYKKYEGLTAKLKSAAKQSANTARETAAHNLQDFMGDCIERRESELGEEITLKQHGKMVKTGTTEVAEVGSPVPARKASKGSAVYGTTNADRLRQLTNMKSLYVSAKNNSRPAIEMQTQAFDRYSQIIDKFGDQLKWAINGLTQELERRETEKKQNEDQQNVGELNSEDNN